MAQKNLSSFNFSSSKKDSYLNQNTTQGSSKHQMPPLFESPRESKNTIFAKRKHIAPLDKKRNLNKLLGTEDFLTEDAKEYDELI